jgi:lipopolysaccharide biosynthesis glycosyltransferase
MTQVEIALASENNYFCGLLVTATSIAHFADQNTVLSFTILDNGISDSNYSFLEKTILERHKRSILQRIKISDANFSGLPLWHGNKAAYARLLLPKLLPDNVTHIIYSDVDFLWMADITNLWDMKNDEIPFISAKDLNEIIKSGESRWCKTRNIHIDMENYFCSGLSFFNLSFFRKNNTAQKIINLILQYPDIGSPDQTALNVVLNGRHKIVDQCWQRFSRDSPVETITAPMALHYAGDAPWIISKRSRMITDIQLLWFRHNASIRKITLWQSLRLHYSTVEIITYRILFKLIMNTPLRWAFNLFLAKTGRWGFYEQLKKNQFKILMSQLTF